MAEKRRNPPLFGVLVGYKSRTPSYHKPSYIINMGGNMWGHFYVHPHQCLIHSQMTRDSIGCSPFFVMILVMWIFSFWDGCAGRQKLAQQWNTTKRINSKRSRSQQDLIAWDNNDQSWLTTKEKASSSYLYVTNRWDEAASAVFPVLWLFRDSYWAKNKGWTGGARNRTPASATIHYTATSAL